MIKYNKDVICILKKSEEEMFESNSKLVDINHLILATLKLNNNVKKLLNKYNITYNSYKEKLNISKKSDSSKLIFYSINLKKILDLSYDTANRYSSNEIFIEHIFITIINENIDVQLLKDLDENLEDFYKDLVKSLTNKSTGLLLDIGTDLTNLAKSKKLSRAIGRKKEINEVIGILARKNKNNPILIGEAGVGKTAIVEELANMIVNNNVPDFLKNKKILSINIASIISGTKYRGEFEEKLTKILNECEANDDLIIFIDEIHTIVGAGGAEGAIDASNILKPILARGTLKIIGATTINEYKKFITEDKALDRRFQKVCIKEPNSIETYHILKKIKNEYEKFHNVKISNKLLKNIIELSNKYIFDRNNPDKSIDILDEACAYTSILSNNYVNKLLNNELTKIHFMKENSIRKSDFESALKYKEKEQEILKMNIKFNQNRVSLETIIKIIESKCNSNIYDLESKSLYDYLKKELKKKIIGQEECINTIVDKLNLLKNKKNNLPISFLLEGYDGTGKTTLVTELSNLLNRNLIKLNMNEFNSEISINKIIGSPQGYIGYNDNNTIFESLKLNPNSIILIDEIDKAHISVLDLISKILEDGFIRNSKNETISFKNSIIFFTTNLISKSTIGYVNSNTSENNNIPKYITDKINYKIKLNKLNKENLKNIMEIQLKKLNNDYNSNIIISDTQMNALIKSLNSTNGAKNIDKILKDYIEKKLIASNTL